MKSVCILGHIASETRKIFSIPSEVETRVWSAKYMRNELLQCDLLSNMEYTPREAGLSKQQVHV